MKNLVMKTHNKLILISLLGVATMLSCNDLLKDYKLDTNPDFLKTMTLLDYIEQGRDTTLTLYADAIAYADLTDFVSEGNKTRIVPTNNAIRTLLASAGISSIRDLSPNVVRGLFSYLNMPGEYRSVDLEEDQTIEGETRYGEPLFLTRLVSSTDRYRLVVNRSDLFATSPINVIRQDYVFMDGVAHVVDVFPIFQQVTTATDTAPEDVDYSDAVKDTLWATDDAHAYAGNRTANYNAQVNQLVSRSGQYRYTFLKFDVDPIDYVDELTSARLHFFVNVINGSNFVPFCGVHETTDDSWEAPTLNWNNMPGFGPEVATSELALDWNEINLTGYIQNAYQDEKSVISLGLQLLNGANVTSSSVQIRNMEVTGGIYRQFIALMGPIPSELEISSSNPVVVANNGVTTLTKDHISMSATSVQYNYTDNNILYALMEPPTNGTLTKNGLPVMKFAQFTQQEIAQGAIKYVHNGGGSDTFQLKALDYIGGVYPELLPISVTVQ